VSRVCAEIKVQYEAWRDRRLEDVEMDYLFLDASFFRYHANATAEPVLAAWGITTEGKPTFIGRLHHHAPPHQAATGTAVA
jgi:putative transposase